MEIQNGINDRQSPTVQKKCVYPQNIYVALFLTKSFTVVKSNPRRTFQPPSYCNRLTGLHGVRQETHLTEGALRLIDFQRSAIVQMLFLHSAGALLLLTFAI